MRMLIKKCSVCKVVKQLDNFSWKNKKEGRKQSCCVECQRKAVNKHYENNKVYYKTKASKRRKIVKDRAAAAKHDMKKDGCILCPEKFYYAIDMHHIDPNEKEDIISRLSEAKLRKELKKCVPLCANCHRKLHFNHTETVEKYALVMATPSKR